MTVGENQRSNNNMLYKNGDKDTEVKYSVPVFFIVNASSIRKQEFVQKHKLMEKSAT